MCDAAILCIVFGMVCSHGVAAWYEPSRAKSLGEFFFPLAGWQQGYVSFGGVGGAVLGLIVTAKLHRQPPLLIVDLAGPAVFPGCILGRIGCFLNGCCYGVETTMPWGVPFRAIGSSAAVSDMPALRHPVQLYDAAISAAAFLFLMIFIPRLKMKAGSGSIIALSLLLYLAMRFLTEFFRIGATARRVLLGLSTGQVVAVVGGAICVLYLSVASSRRRGLA